MEAQKLKGAMNQIAAEHMTEGSGRGKGLQVSLHSAQMLALPGHARHDGQMLSSKTCVL